MLENNIFFLGARSASVGPRGVCQPPADWEKAPEAGQGASWAERSALSQPRGRRGATLAILRETPHPRTQGPRRPARGSSAPLGGGHGTETAERTPHALVPCGSEKSLHWKRFPPGRRACAHVRPSRTPPPACSLLSEALGPAFPLRCLAGCLCNHHLPEATDLQSLPGQPHYPDKHDHEATAHIAQLCKNRSYQKQSPEWAGVQERPRSKQIPKGKGSAQMKGKRRGRRG